MDGSKNIHPFDQDLSLTRLEPFRFCGTVTDNWSINGIPNGGYLMALLAHAMLQESAKKDTLVVTANYLHRCEIGEADLVVKAAVLLLGGEHFHLEGLLLGIPEKGILHPCKFAAELLLELAFLLLEFCIPVHELDTRLLQVLVGRE